MFDKRLILFIYLMVKDFIKLSQCIHCECKRNEEFSNLIFPQGFLFGIGTSAYQIEGAWNKDGKGVHIWDTFTHEHPEKIADRSNADDACLSYYKYKEDIQYVRDLCIDIYRISISWTRILPDGTNNKIEKRGVEFYHKLIDEVLSTGIQPMVTMNHFDLPQALQNNGGWLNNSIIQIFTDYCDLLFSLYGNKVKMWLTINEPIAVQEGYSDTYFAPGIPGHGVNTYVVGHNILLAHASVYRLYQNKYKASQNGILSIPLNGHYCFPQNNNDDDKEAAERFLQFNLGWFAHPIYSEEGDYPAVMRKNIDRNSAKEGRCESRLPRFTKDQIEFVKGTYDFFALSYYLSSTCKAGYTGVNPSWERDTAVISDCSKPMCPDGDKYFIPEGFTAILNWVKHEYNNPLVYITENGYPSTYELNDERRIKYINDHLVALLKSINEGAKIMGYSAWSLLDVFELDSGYSIGYGLVQVNMSDPERTRTMKKSAYFYKSLIENHKCT